ncbi:DNA polymerase Y family protein [Adhaeretor mobilis]|nr:nucleotidyltransferase [Adhaeretor mobilis]
MIGHVDADCFYVSAERVRHRHLLGLPVGVLGNHGACIIAKSYEMKASGVGTGVPIWEAAKICPEGIYVKRDFRWYEVLSRKMLDVVKRHSPRVEFYSVDESFFQARSWTAKDASGLQRELIREVGVPVSVGIAPTKTLAKLISDSVKPFGYGVALTESARRELLEGLPVTEITGIAKRSAVKLASHGITTCDQLAAADRAFVRWLLTKRGEDLWWELNGTSVLPINVARPVHKFVSRGGSIGRASSDRQRVAAYVVRNVERLVEALDHYKLVCDQLTLSLLFRDAPERGQRVSLLGSTSGVEPLRQAALWLLPQVWQPPRAAVHYMHVIAGRLWPRWQSQPSLFDQPALRDPQQDTRTAALETVTQQVNASVGRFALRSGMTTPLADVHADPANEYDICDIYGKSCF